MCYLYMKCINNECALSALFAGTESDQILPENLVTALGRPSKPTATGQTQHYLTSAAVETNVQQQAKPWGVPMVLPGDGGSETSANTFWTLS